MVSVAEKIRIFESVEKDFPALSQMTKFVSSTDKIEGRDFEAVLSGLNNPDKANLVFLAEPGIGKTSYVAGFAQWEGSGSYLVREVDTIKMIDSTVQNKDLAMQQAFAELFDEAVVFMERTGLICCLFIDELHKLFMAYPSVMQELKPKLERSARDGFRILTATTSSEYDQYIVNDEAFDQRMTRINVEELEKRYVLKIMENVAKRTGVLNLCEPNLFDEIYQRSKQYLPFNAQPRASKDLFSEMIGVVTKNVEYQNGQRVNVFKTVEEMGYPSEFLLNQFVLAAVIRRRFNIDIHHSVNIEAIEKDLKSKIIGQDESIDAVLRAIRSVKMGHMFPDRPVFSFMTPGPTGVGKTELAEQLSAALGRPLIILDMTSYNRPEHAEKAAETLAKMAWAHPDAYFLIDEFEKAHEDVIRVFFPVLDKGRLLASVGGQRNVSFAGTILQFTTNVGSDLYQQSQLIGGEVSYKAVYDSFKKEGFSTALLGRVDKFVIFKTLDDDCRFELAKKFLELNLRNSRTRDRDYLIADEVLKTLVIDRASKDSEHGGARDIRRELATFVVEEISQVIDQPQSVSLIVGLSGRIRYLDPAKNVGDLKGAKLKIVECYPQSIVAQILKRISGQLGVELKGQKLFIPKSMDLKVLFKDIQVHVKNGYRIFTTKVFVRATSTDSETIISIQPVK